MLDDFIPNRASQAEALNEAYGRLEPADLLSAALIEPDMGSVALVSSFGAESVVLLHMISKIDPALPVLFIDTQMLFAETIEYQTDVARDLGLSQITRITPDAASVALDDPDGRLHKTAPDACCALRKTAPLQQALAPFDTWITGRKRFQSATRAQLDYFEADGPRLKLNPLAHWSATQLASYMDRYALPRHPLVAKGYASLGCAPCTRPTAPHENARAGRWSDQDKVECGIHFTKGQVQRPDTQRNM